MSTSAITILTGAGFSVSAGLPTAKDLGQILLSTNEKDYFIHTDQVLYPNQRGVEYECDPSDPWPKLLSFMREYAKVNNDVFNYEEFFDCINHLHKKMPLPIRRRVLGRESNNISSLELLRQSMVRAFQQLIKYHLSNTDGKTNGYGGFVELLKYLSPRNNINLYTLNHDIFMEQLLSGFDIEFSDGFTEDSPYYYQPAGSEDKIKVQVYSDNYLPRCILFHKLHGSIDYFKSYKATGKTQSGLSECRADGVFKCNGTMGGDMYIKTDSDYKSCFALDPLFLSGTRSKVENYGGLYVSRQMTHFQEDVANTDMLLVIGYGFADSKINEFILDNLKPDSCVIVVDKYLTQDDVLRKLNYPTTLNLVVHTGSGVEDISPSILQ